MITRFKYVVVFSVLLIAHKNTIGQEKNFQNDIFLIDTIEVVNPIMLTFKNIRNGHRLKAKNSVLISVDNLEMLENKCYRDYSTFIKKNGYKIESPARFQALLMNVPDSVKEKKFLELEKEMRDYCNSWRQRNDTIPLFSEGNFIKKNIESSRVNTSTFLIYLIKISVLNDWEEIGHSKLEDIENCYLRLAIPAPWLDKKLKNL